MPPLPISRSTSYRPARPVRSCSIMATVCLVDFRMARAEVRCSASRIPWRGGQWPVVSAGDADHPAIRHEMIGERARIVVAALANAPGVRAARVLDGIANLRIEIHLPAGRRPPKEVRTAQ